MITLLSALVGCENHAPRLLSVNGQPYGRDPLGGVSSGPGFEISTGQTFALSLEVEDPDGDPVEIRFSDMPGLVSFDPRGTRGTLEPFDPPIDTGAWMWDGQSLIVLTDDRSPPGWAEYELHFFYPTDL